MILAFLSFFLSFFPWGWYCSAVDKKLNFEVSSNSSHTNKFVFGLVPLEKKWWSIFKSSYHLGLELFLYYNKILQDIKWEIDFLLLLSNE